MLHSQYKRIYAEFMAKTYLRWGRGHDLLDFITNIAKNVVYFGGAGVFLNYYLHTRLSYVLLFIVALSFEVACYIAGWIDERVGFWKFQNDYNTKVLTPFFGEMQNEIKQIHEEVTKEFKNRRSKIPSKNKG